jgi:hypothetical protein
MDCEDGDCTVVSDGEGEAALVVAGGGVELAGAGLAGVADGVEG